uniref:Transcriptional activator protein n=1 Tax=Pepper yellow vein Mali virus TaxID=260378 RepID=A4Q9N0_9GEMI|nr:AC2 protein [Pepper yellow vein Mali virus]CAM84537.1 AC2 protein [Pepper yellow vein Mali virus]
MQPSSPSTGHSTQVPIKVIHRRAKTKAIRRKRIDLDCGCSYYLHIDCINHGFTHRGITHCNSMREWRLYLDNQKSPLFQNNQAPRETIQQTMGHNPHTNPIQPQFEESIGDTPVLSGLPDLDSLTTSDLAFLKSI